MQIWITKIRLEHAVSLPGHGLAARTAGGSDKLLKIRPVGERGRRHDGYMSRPVLKALTYVRVHIVIGSHGHMP